MFGFFGIGPTEFLVVLLTVAVSFGIPLATLVLVVVLVRRTNPARHDPSYEQLREENERLRAQIKAIKEQSGGPA